MKIVGAGLAGLIAAHAWPQATILEAAPRPHEAHKALLRFRSDAVSRLTGIEFRKVRVRKGIYYDGDFVQPSIKVANLYCRKVLGNLSGDRSIWNLDPVDRFIAPETFYEQMLDVVGRRISWGVAADYSHMSANKEPVVSTAPMHIVLAALNNDPPCPLPAFNRKAITVRRWRIPKCDLFQTVYFPQPNLSLYRASITGDLLIAEFAGMGSDRDDTFTLTALSNAFGISMFTDVEQLEDVHQKYGKIEPIPDDWRKAILFDLTQKHCVYSLGRFATWRNILLDDVVDDIAVIKRLMRSSGYDQRKVAS